MLSLNVEHAKKNNSSLQGRVYHWEDQGAADYLGYGLEDAHLIAVFRHPPKNPPYLIYPSCQFILPDPFFAKDRLR